MKKSMTTRMFFFASFALAAVLIFSTQSANAQGVRPVANNGKNVAPAQNFSQNHGQNFNQKQAQPAKQNNPARHRSLTITTPSLTTTTFS